MPTIRPSFTSALLAVMLFAAAPASKAQVSSQGEPSSESKQAALTPEQKMARRFPHPVRVGFLIGRPVLDDDDNTIGYVRRVVRSADGKIQLIVRHGGWFGWIGWWQRPVAVPIEAVAMLGQFVAAIDMPPDEFRKAPTWEMSVGAADISPDEQVRVALTKR